MISQLWPARSPCKSETILSGSVRYLSSSKNIGNGGQKSLQPADCGAGHPFLNIPEDKTPSPFLFRMVAKIENHGPAQEHEIEAEGRIICDQVINSVENFIETLEPGG